MNYSPAWCVRGYFIPFVNLVQPYEAMRESWQISHNPADWKHAAVSPVLRWWWGLWLGTNVLGVWSAVLWSNASSWSDVWASMGFSILSSAIAIPLCLVAIRLVKTIQQAQDRLVSGIVPPLVTRPPTGSEVVQGGSDAGDGNPECQGYTDIVFYRQQWFFWLTFFVFQPLALGILITGDVYYLKNREVKPFGRPNRIAAGVFAAFMSIAYLALIFGPQ